MSGQARLAVCSVVATLAAACALLPLVDRPVWIVQAALLLSIQTAVGAVARRVPLRRGVTVALQALAALLLLTLVFAQQQAMGGLLPGPDVFREFGQLLQEGADDVGRYAIPAPATRSLRLLLVGGVLTVGLAVDALAVTFRSAAPAGLPLLALYSIGAGLGRGGGHWLWFLAAATGYLLLLLAEGRDRLTRWGRVFGGGPPGGSPPATAGGTPRHPAAAGAGRPPAAVRTGRRIGAVALGIALVVPAALPSIDEGLLQAHGAGDGPGDDGGTISAVNPLVSLQNSLNQPENREVLRYRTSSENTQDLYLRIVALDSFDGSSWRASERRVTDVPDPLPTPAGLSPAVRTDPVNTSVAAAGSYGQTYLPMPYPAERVLVGGQWRYEPEGRALVGDHGQSTRGLRYQVSSLLVEPTAAQLAAAPAPPEQLLRAYTRVPASLPGVVAETARKVTAGTTSAYQQAVKLQDWFSASGGFRYDTQVQTGGGSNAIVKFLEDRQGFCVHFAFSMATMARTLGIPARVAVGFTPGTPQPDGSVSVGSKDAHAWPELYFEGAGWTRFEPTPTRGTQPDYSVDRAPTTADPGAPAPLPSRAGAPSAVPSADADCPPQERRLGECRGQVLQADTDGTGGGPLRLTTAVVVAAALAALILPLVPPLWRRRARARRLGRGGAVEGTLAAWQEMTDSAWDYGIPPDEAQTPRNAAARIVRIAELDGPAAEAAGRLATAVEQALYAPDPRPAGDPAADAERVRAGLHATALRSTRLRAALAPRSAARLRWGLAARLGAVGSAWRRVRGRAP
ncbi:transglutaminaseTgpA domain-containing protein [Streptoverticillium reticulum]|uniref:transglutaminaseTgpA domain-containing protein n=1 Tax=Streptoverticillium reticulum TaxID=1433415 RepID=UPI0039BFD680